MNKIDIYFDGACHNKKDEKTPMGIGVVVKFNGEIMQRLGVAAYVGMGTSNIAEWEACLRAFKILAALYEVYPPSETMYQIFSDSQIISYQYNGKYGVNKEDFLPYFKECRAIAEKIRWHGHISWIRREYNTDADVLSKKGLELYHRQVQGQP